MSVAQPVVSRSGRHLGPPQDIREEAFVNFDKRYTKQRREISYVNADSFTKVMLLIIPSIFKANNSV